MISVRQGYIVTKKLIFGPARHGLEHLELLEKS